MKHKFLYAFLIVLMLAGWVAINRETFPPPPDNFEELSKTVNLRFKIINMDVNKVEMALNEGRGPNNLFVLFELSDDWVKGNFGLVVKNMSEKSNLQSKSGKKPDISRFEKDNRGQKVSFYTFDQTMVKSEDGTTYIQMKYSGPPMPLIQSLNVERNFVMPRHISARFVNRGNVEFIAGKYGLDPKINGFWIPVKISM